ncbi:MAG: ribonuclease P protein component [Anaerolineae bacterium]
MLPGWARLRHGEDFERVRRQGKRWNGTYLRLNVAPNGRPNSRFGFVVSRKVGNTVTRNRIKRRLRAAVRRRLADIAVGFDVVVIAHPSAAEASYHDLDASLGKLLQLACLVSAEDTP